jgi:hypothetical protein
MVKMNIASVGALSCFICRVYTNVLWPCMEKKDRGKDGRWDTLSWRRASCPSRRGGFEHGCVLRHGGGVGARAAVGASDEASERERDGERAGNATVHDKLKRGS